MLHMQAQDLVVTFLEHRKSAPLDCLKLLKLSAVIPQAWASLPPVAKWKTGITGRVITIATDCSDFGWWASVAVANCAK